MRALVWDGHRLRHVEDVPPPPLTPETALVRIRLAGVCSTDLQILRGYMGFRGIPGHEFVGEVVEGPTELRGRRVVGEINFACGRCRTCEAGRARHCPERTVLGIEGADGAFAEFVRLPIGNLHVVPDEIGDREAVFTEPLAAAFEADLQTRSLAGCRSAVLGAGKLGLLVAQVLALRGDRVVVLCRSDAARQRCRELDLEALEPSEAPRDHDLVVDATGSAEGLSLALGLVRPLGSIVAKTTIADAHHLSLAPLVIDEVTLIGSRCGPFEPALAALEGGRVSVGPLIEQVYPLEQGLDAVEHAARPGVLKILLEPDLRGGVG